MGTPAIHRFRNRDLTRCEISAITGIPALIISARLAKGWDIEPAATTPLRAYSRAHFKPKKDSLECPECNRIMGFTVIKSHRDFSEGACLDCLNRKDNMPRLVLDFLRSPNRSSEVH